MSWTSQEFLAPYAHFRVQVGSCFDVKSSQEEENIKWDTAHGAGKDCTHIAWAHGLLGIWNILMMG